MADATSCASKDAGDEVTVAAQEVDVASEDRHDDIAVVAKDVYEAGQKPCDKAYIASEDTHDDIAVDLGGGGLFQTSMGPGVF